MRRQEGEWDRSRAEVRGTDARCRARLRIGAWSMEDGQLKSVGRHLILEMWGCRNLNSTEIVERALRDVVREADLTLLDLNVYPFTPIGVTGVAVVTESHVMIHTWPEYGYAAVDVFTCGDQANPEAALPLLREHFAPERIQIMEINRGIMPQEPAGTPQLFAHREPVTT
jgi:S-adenosylmethionine decarboxylase